MKPVELRISGWGPYKELQTIDFTRMEERGLFLITGATGAGKTTIFDAIMYALYGCMSGEVREKGSVRSDFAKPDTPTFVELSMTHKGESYHIYRNPEYLRPRKRKGADGKELTKEKEKAILTLPDGSSVEGSSEVTRKIEELLCLDYRQFKQISMIAQGEFTKLLTASSQEKTKIFRQIFDTGLYERIAQLLKERSNAIYKEVSGYRHKMDEDVELYHPLEESAEVFATLVQGEAYDYEAVLAFLKEEKKRIGKEEKEVLAQYQKLEERTLVLNGKLVEAQKAAELQKSLERETERKQLLDHRKEEMQQKEILLWKADRAGEIRQQELLCEESAKQIDKIKQQIRHLQEETGLREQQILTLQKLPEYQADFEAACELKEKLSEQERESEHNIKLCKQLEAQLKQLQEVYLKLEQEELFARQTYEETEHRYRHNLAGILSSELEENRPCPVCGSLHHPAPAAVTEEHLTREKVDQAKKTWLQKQEKTMRQHGETMAARGKAEQAKEKGCELMETIGQLQERKEQLPGEIKVLLSKYTRKSFEGELNRLLQLRVERAEKQEQIGNLQEELQKGLELFREREEERDILLTKYGFASREEYQGSLLSKEQIEAGKRELQDYEKNCRANEELLQHLKEQVQELVLADPVKLKEELKEALEEKRAVQQMLSKKQESRNLTERTYSSLKTKLAGLKETMERYTLVKGLDDLANGNNKKRLVFEQYVLISCFEEILYAANLRLQTMSAGRYELRRVRGIVDARSKDNLEMEVLDYYTGKYRSVKTLSGGESFKVSLSLALGMSDVIQAQSGGIRVETMFIDEGFGTLDGESLDQACLVLQGLTESNRLIGLISHVPELSEKIPDQIRIHKTNTGSYAEVVIQ
jgi:exonuclease SbcC